MNLQGGDIDGLSGATVTANAVKKERGKVADDKEQIDSLSR